MHTHTFSGSYLKMYRANVSRKKTRKEATPHPGSLSFSWALQSQWPPELLLAQHLCSVTWSPNLQTVSCRVLVDEFGSARTQKFRRNVLTLALGEESLFYFRVNSDSLAHSLPSTMYCTFPVCITSGLKDSCYETALLPLRKHSNPYEELLRFLQVSKSPTEPRLPPSCWECIKQRPSPPCLRAKLSAVCPWNSEALL